MHQYCPGAILVVEDEIAHQRILTTILAREGYAVQVAASASAALDAARATPPDLVILDVCLSDGPGHALCRALRREPALAEVPVIFTSAAHDTTSKVLAFAEGAVDFIDKPFQVAELVARVRSHLRLHGLKQEVAARAAALERANQCLARDLIARDSGLAGVSHELRTPLNTVLGLAQLLDDGVYGPMAEPQREAVALIAASGQHLLSLVNDLLDLARIEAGREELHLAPVDLAAACAAALDLVHAGALAAEVRLVARLAPGLPPLFADRRRLVQILVNLLANAIRFSQPGEEVGLDMASTPDGAGVRFSVSDGGPGIPLEQQAGLFRPFARLDGASRRGGAGLGLALVAQFARMHGGAVALESGAGTGSRFSVTLPAHAPARGAASVQEQPASAPLALIVDEYAPAAEALAGELRLAGYNCLIAHDPVATVAAVTRARPAVAVVALPLSDHQGDETLPLLRAALVDTPLLALGTVQLPPSAERALALGADAYLPRPLALGAVVATLDHLGQSLVA